MKSMSFLRCVSLGFVVSLSNVFGAGFSPVPLTSTSYNQDVVIEKTAPPPPPLLTTASMDQGLTNTGFGWYEVGYNADAPDTGLPAAGSTVTSESLPDHSYRLAPSYTNSNAVLVDSVVTNATVQFTTPTAFSGLSFLTSAGNGAVTVRYTAHHADGTQETNTFVSQDWFGGTNSAVTANGRLDVVTRALDAVSGGNPHLYSTDATLSNTTSPVSSVDFTMVSGGGHAAIFAVSGSTGTAFTPIGITGYNVDMVVEASAPALPTSLNVTSASVDAGTGNTGFSFYEQGYATLSPTSGLPPAGGMVTNLSAADHIYKLAPSYTTNNALLVDATGNGTLTLVTPAAYAALSFLTAAGSGTVTNTYTVTHADGSTEVGTLVSLDWFNNTPFAFTARGRASVESGVLDSVNTDNPRLYSVDIALTNTTSPVNSIDLAYSDGAGHALILALSGATGSVAPIFDVQPTAVNSMTGSNVQLSASVSGLGPIQFQWQKSTSSSVTNATFSNLANGGTISGATTANLLLSNITLSDGGLYRLLASNASGSSTSAPVKVTIISSGTDVTVPTDEITAFGGTSPAAEVVANAIDDTTAKYLNFGTDGDQNPPFVGPVGLIVTPAAGSTTVTGLRIYTANDAPERDPIDYKLEGATGTDTNYTLIASGSLSLPDGRNATGLPLDPLTQFNQEVLFSNSTAYSSYRVTFTHVKSDTTANSMQIGEIELLTGTGTPPESGGPTVSISRAANGSLTITSSQSGTLQSTTAFSGSSTVWQTEGPISGSMTVTITGQAKFYRVSVP